MTHLLTRSIAAAALALTAGLTAPSSAAAEEKYIGEIFMGGWNFCPRGSAALNGQLLPISQNTALFSLLGTQFGGDGVTTFGLPDMRGRVPMHEGTGPGLSPRRIGEKGGSETNTLSPNQMPAHSHALSGSTSPASSASPAGNLLGTTGRNATYGGGSADAAMSGASIGSAGGGQAVNNMQPYQVITYCIAIHGIFPSRS